MDIFTLLAYITFGYIAVTCIALIIHSILVFIIRPLKTYEKFQNELVTIDDPNQCPACRGFNTQLERLTRRVICIDCYAVSEYNEQRRLPRHEAQSKNLPYFGPTKYDYAPEWF